MADESTCAPLTRASVFNAHEIIKSRIHKTPVLTSRFLNQLASTEQGTDAFKARGAFHAIEKLKQEPGWLENDGAKKGVVCFSAGNHAQAIALAARESQITAHIVMPETSSPVKIQSVREYGANLTLCGRFEREACAAETMAKTGARLIPPFDHPDVILGQGTAALELQEEVKELNAIVSPCSGGGLLAGTALSCEGTGIRVYGAEPEFEGADDGRRGFLSGERVTHVKSNTIADGLMGKLGVLPWEIIYERRLVDMMYAVTEENILDAMKLIFERLKLVVEPAAAVPLAVVLYNEEFRGMVEREAGEKGWDVGIILSGGNVGVGRISDLFARK
ncbi:unnamed protein product [Penicillium salamii]|uniref:Tryptophan synthase beta chain-like PALP domain-containing protein n=1 Tax=Penicillium salamii TaxID=1612424 RepID=A0A9W4ISY3_9EURO|nr:unnamed protein product [Penicillium salamii]CAG7996219.1 unnamed protein product [Penicillium salamii]CAG8164227.1 unnamed protein product [Penicillium salamii]CAG8193656.1 unnamed protein product [Penicillium salamii]CAG8225744.1 unnamed protein product [Penicillium salamii]